MAESKPPVAALVSAVFPAAPAATDTGPPLLRVNAGEDERIRALIKPAPFGLPQPVARSKPGTAG